jgi:hypothetical protein
MNTLQRKKKVAPTQEITNNALESKIRLPTLCCQPRHQKNPTKKKHRKIGFQKAKEKQEKRTRIITPAMPNIMARMLE